MKKYLDQGNFNDRVYKKINEIIEKYGKDNPDYREKPFAVFDWDNTSIIGDVEEAFFYYMVTNLCFKIGPDELYEIIRKNVSREDFGANLDGEKIGIDHLSKDIREAYEKLHQTSDRLGGDIGFDIIKATNAYKEFVAKMFFRYKFAKVDPKSDEKYIWIGYLLKNYKNDDLEKLCQEVFAYMKKQKPRWVDFISPDIRSMAGRVSLKYFCGISDIAEMADLYRALEENGIDLYIVSASISQIVKSYATANAYKLDDKKVIGQMLLVNEDGKIIPSLDTSLPMTAREGKVETIKKLIKNDFGPIIVGGDSDGDYAMLSEFDQTALSLIIDRDIEGQIEDLKVRTKSSDRYMVQARDLAKMTFIKSEKSKEIL